MSKSVVGRFGVVHLDFMVLGKPDAEPHHHLTFVLVDFGVVYLPFVEGHKVRMLQVSTER